ncbi:MAG: biotin--[acetyl-CoA-carboxylase] ligase [Candidatus Kapaibacterium sp.]|nr:MAG: biotin--[acetyl-CoA-carboxylase] ligase [Candidatus Kapabacteria bacterium]
MKHSHYDELPSTNDKAKELLRLNTAPLLAVTADLQTHGRGRNGKVWIGEHEANVYCSVGMRHFAPLSEQRLIAFQIIGCLAAKAALQEASSEARNHAGCTAEFCLKYPNDVYLVLPNVTPVQRRKVCGVLVEHEFIGSSCVSSVIGIGINVRQKVFPEDLQMKATSLLREGIDATTEHVRHALLRYIQLFLKQSNDALFTAWRDELQLEGEYISIAKEQGLWRVESIQDDGRLRVIHTETQQQRFVDNGDSILRADWQ